MKTTLRPCFEVADVFVAGLAKYQAVHRVSPVQRKAINAIMNCRTAVLGGHKEICINCGTLSISYNSCRHRACPKCQWSAQVRWIQKRADELLQTTYYHLVFTVPHGLNPLFLSNDKVLYNLLMRCAWDSLDQLAQDPVWLGAQTGMLAVLHTWGQKLDYHPHVHCIVPGGGLQADGSWKSARKGFFIPVRVLSTLFRGKFLATLQTLRQQGKLEFHGSSALYEDQQAFNLLLKKLYKTGWVVYAKAPMGGPAQVLNYLGRYTHRIAIGNRRITNLANGRVTFTYKDRQHNDQQKQLTLDDAEFIRRFLSHVLPEGFHKIRHYGLLAIRNRQTKLLAAQLLLLKRPLDQVDSPGLVVVQEPGGSPCCPICGAGGRIKVEVLPAQLFKPTLSGDVARAPPRAQLLLT